MRVKIGKQWFDSSEVPICVQLSEADQQNIAAIDRTVAPQGKYASFPDNTDMTSEQMREWMNEDWSEL
ncbi:MAG: hypothetical protein VX796_05810 [Pseudomonadota bacterium]|nr:hypothetical protein [Pseudomonadota bacterium]